MSAILRLFGIQPSPRPFSLKCIDGRKSRTETAELNMSRSVFANTLAAAALNMETLKLCKQTEEIRRITQCDHQTDAKTCANCKHCVGLDECEVLGLEKDQLRITTARTDCRLWEPKP